jgi:hypothetical protein
MAAILVEELMPSRFGEKGAAIMQWYTLAVGAALALLIGTSIWLYAYRLGLKRGRSLAVPFRLVDELLDHRIGCCGQDPATARIAVGTLLGITEWEAQDQREERGQERREHTPSYVYH